MKKIIRFLIFGILVALFCESNAFAQSKWLPFSGSFSIPMMMTHHDISTLSEGDSAWIVSKEISMANLQTHSQIGDSIYYSWGYSDTITPFATAHFLVDTVNKKLRNFSFQTGFGHTTYVPPYDTYGTGSSFFIIFPLLDYQLDKDSSIVVYENGNACMHALDTAYYDYGNQHQHTGKDIYTTGYSDFTHYLIKDTTSYKCSLVFTLAKPINAVYSGNSTNQNFFATTSIQNHSIYFSFPSSDHPQSLTIYDILGREVKRIEIPSGVSDYNLSREGFPTGCYFARLGNLNAKFVVN